MYKFKVFTAEWCSVCQNLKQWMDSENIPYTTVDIDSDDGMQQAQKHRIRSLPVTHIVNEDGELVDGVDPIIGFASKETFLKYTKSMEKTDAKD